MVRASPCYRSTEWGKRPFRIGGEMLASTRADPSLGGSGRSSLCCRFRGRRLGHAVLEHAGRGSSDGRPGKILRPANPDDELDRSLDLESRADLLAPRVLLKSVRHRVVCNPQVGGSQEGTLVYSAGLEQTLDAAIGTGKQQEASAPLELPSGDLDRGSSKGRSQSLLPGEGGVPDRPRKRGQPEGLGGQPIAPRSDVPAREAEPSGKLRLLPVVPCLLGEGLGRGVDEPAAFWALARHEGEGNLVGARELFDIARVQLHGQEGGSGGCPRPDQRRSGRRNGWSRGEIRSSDVGRFGPISEHLQVNPIPDGGSRLANRLDQGPEGQQQLAVGGVDHPQPATGFRAKNEPLTFGLDDGPGLGIVPAG